MSLISRTTRAQTEIATYYQAIGIELSEELVIRATSPHRTLIFWTYAQTLDVVLKPGATTRDEVANHQCDKATPRYRDRFLSKNDFKPRLKSAISLWEGCAFA